MEGPFDMTRIRFLKMPYLAFVRCRIVDVEIEFSKYYPMMAILVKRRVDTRTHHQIWLRGEDKIDRREVMASILEPSEVVVSPVYQLLDSAFKSPMATIKNGLAAETASSISSKLLQKFSELSSD